MTPAGAPLRATTNTTTTIPTPLPARHPSTPHHKAIIGGCVTIPPHSPPPVQSGRVGLAQRRPNICRRRSVGRHTTRLPPVDHRHPPGRVRRVAPATVPPIDGPSVVVDRNVPHGGTPPRHRSREVRRPRGRQLQPSHAPAAAAVAAARTARNRTGYTTAGAAYLRAPRAARPSPAARRIAAAAAVVCTRVGGLGGGGWVVPICSRRWVGRRRR